MNYNEMKAYWRSEAQHAFSGWDFSYLNGRCDFGSTPWDYRQIVLDALKPDDRLLDMDTGGGEFLLALEHDPHLTSVTEGWEPNLALCRAKLAPLGITVRACLENDRLDYSDGAFDMVINRHGAFDAVELSRVLRPGGLFVTQQVGGRNNNDLSRRLIPDFKPNFPAHTLKKNVELLEQAGFEILRAEECFPVLKFYDTGAIAFYAARIPWEFTDFSVERDFDRLCELQREIELGGFVLSTEHRFVIVARRP